MHTSSKVRAEAAVPAERMEPLILASWGLRPPPLQSVLNAYEKQAWQMLILMSVHPTLNSC